MTDDADASTTEALQTRIGFHEPVPGHEILAGGGAMGALMRAKDWSRTAFGPPSQWPQSLRTSISIMLEARFPMVVAWGPQFRFLYNDGYRPILGKTKHPGALGSAGAEIFPEIWSIVGPEFERVRRGESFAVEDWLLPLDRNGYLENCWFTLSYSPIRDESGGVGGLLAVVAETTGRVEGERRLATLRELARRTNDAKSARAACEVAGTIFASNPIDVPFSLAYLFDGDHGHLVATSGVSAGSVSAPIEVALSGELQSRNTWPLRRARESRSLEVVTGLDEKFGPITGGAYPENAHTAVMLPLARPSGGPVYGALILGVSPRRALDDRYQGFYELAAEHVVAAIANATAYEAERQRAEALAELDRAKTAFFSNVSHEFRTPLTLMLGPLEDLLRGARGDVPPTMRGDIDAAHRNALRLLKLVNTLLDFSRIEAGRVEAVFEPVDLAATTREMVSGFRSAIERAGLTMIVDCPSLPEPIYVDRDLWEKIVLNLLSNALKFTFDGSITIALRWIGAGAALEVSDTGVGIPEEEIPNLFKRFHRVQGTRARSHEGSGIGLALVHDVAAIHGGRVAIRSAPGNGSTFTVTIPSGTAHLAADQIGVGRERTSTAVRPEMFLGEATQWLPNEVAGDSAGERSLAESEPESFDARVLVVDDNADMRGYIARLLSDTYAVDQAVDGIDALSRIERRMPDLILTDVMMPRMDGFALLKALRENDRTRQVPVLMLSARAGEESTVEGLGAGADDYLIKPFSAQELRARVKTHMDLLRARRNEVSEQVRARRQIDELYHRVQEANAGKSQFLAAMSHELRTPLNAILGYTDILALGVRGPLTVDQRTDVERVRSASHYLLSLINDILNFTKVEAGQVDFNIQSIDVTELLERSHELVAQSIRDKGIEFTLERPVIPVSVTADAERAQQILLNLLTNAAKFTDRGGRISLSCTVEDRVVSIHVRDTGRGISKMDTERIFNPFVQLDRSPAQDARAGVGLGLAISRDLARRMSGDITLESEPGVGSLFTLRLERSATTS